MLGIKVTIERFTQEWQPGCVECRFDDAIGNSHVFEEKIPVVTDEDLNAQSDYPRPGIIGCELLETRLTRDGREVVVVDTGRPWGIESKNGETRFEVFRDQIVEFDHGAG